MRKFITLICCLSMATIGYMITSNNDSATSVPQNALHAATIPSWNYNGQLPIDVQRDLAKRITPDTIVIHDTVTVKNTKYVRVPVPRHTTDTIYVPLENLPEVEILSVKNKSPGDSEKVSLDEMQSSKQSIVLFIDGNEVYSSKTPNSSKVSDELQLL